MLDLKNNFVMCSAKELYIRNLYIENLKSLQEFTLLITISNNSNLQYTYILTNFIAFSMKWILNFAQEFLFLYLNHTAGKS